MSFRSPGLREAILMGGAWPYFLCNLFVPVIAYMRGDVHAPDILLSHLAQHRQMKIYRDIFSVIWIAHAILVVYVILEYHTYLTKQMPGLRRIMGFACFICWSGILPSAFLLVHTMFTENQSVWSHWRCLEHLGHCGAAAIIFGCVGLLSFIYAAFVEPIVTAKKLEPERGIKAKAFYTRWTIMAVALCFVVRVFHLRDEATFAWALLLCEIGVANLGALSIYKGFQPLLKELDEKKPIFRLSDLFGLARGEIGLCSEANDILVTERRRQWRAFSDRMKLNRNSVYSSGHTTRVAETFDDGQEEEEEGLCSEYYDDRTNANEVVDENSPSRESRVSRVSTQFPPSGRSSTASNHTEKTESRPGSLRIAEQGSGNDNILTQRNASGAKKAQAAVGDN